jgi:CheY-like chemotaxis protein
MRKKDCDVTILVVDDEVDICEVVQIQLEDAGFNVLTANSVEQAKELIKYNDLKVIVSDIHMPEQTGVDLLKWINEEVDPEVRPKVIMMSGYSSFSIIELFSYGIEALFAKPICFDSLIKSVQRSLKSLEEFGQARKYTRFDVEMFVRICSEDGPLDYRAELINIGQGGFFVHCTDHKFTVGDTLTFQIYIDSSFHRPIRGKAVCRWVKVGDAGDDPDSFGEGLGAEIIEMEDSDRKAILELINSFSTNSHSPVM